jgi:prepilin-type N-terminal cleavage/methylation domain-containing protein
MSSRNQTQCASALRSDRSEIGFSLIEVMVAIVILTVGLLTLAQTMVIATRSNELSGRMTSCAALAKEQMERLKAAPFYTDPVAQVRNPVLASGGDTQNSVGGYFQLYDQDGLPAAAGGGFLEVRWMITDIVTPLPLEMVRIDVSCLPAAGRADQYLFIGNANFTTFRTANVG